MRKLSKREKALFEHLEKRAPRVVSYVELYQAVVGEYYRSEQDAINHIRVLIAATRKKLGKDVIVTVHGRGVYLNDGMDLCPCCERILSRVI